MQLRAFALAATLLIAAPLFAQGGTEQRSIQDPQWGAAAIVTLPTGWRFDGMTTHGETCVSQVPGFRYAASSKDGSMRIQSYPEISYTTSRQTASQGCLVTQAYQPEEFLRQVITPALHPGAKVETVNLPTPPEVVQLQRQAAQMDASMRGARQHTDVAQHTVALSWTYNGREYVNVVGGIFRCVQTVWQTTGAQSVECKVSSLVSISAPGDQILALLRNPPMTIRNTAAWDQQSMQLLQQRNAQQQGGMQRMFSNDTQKLMDLHAQLAGAQQAQFDAGQSRAKENAKVLHGVSQDQSNHMADLNIYTNPTTGESYRLSNQYKHTYQNSNGTVLETNSSYSPGPETVWQELQPR